MRRLCVLVSASVRLRLWKSRGPVRVDRHALPKKVAQTEKIQRCLQWTGGGAQQEALDKQH